MNSLSINCTWALRAPLHVGTGLSRGGYIDRLIRVDSNKAPFLPGDAIKGAIRMSAERLLRWLVPDAPMEDDDKSLPTNPVLRRIFQSSDNGVYYRFPPARRVGEHADESVSTYSSTAIEKESRTARNDTLRTTEISSRLDKFQLEFYAEGGDWSVPGSRDWNDALFLCAAIAATEAIGGKRGIGLGALILESPECSTPSLDFALLRQPEYISKLRDHLSAKEEASQ